MLDEKSLEIAANWSVERSLIMHSRPLGFHAALCLSNSSPFQYKSTENRKGHSYVVFSLWRDFNERKSPMHSACVSEGCRGRRYSLVLSLLSFSRMNVSISGALARMRSHCSL